MSKASWRKCESQRVHRLRRRCHFTLPARPSFCTDVCGSLDDARTQVWQYFHSRALGTFLTAISIACSFPPLPRPDPIFHCFSLFGLCPLVSPVALPTLVFFFQFITDAHFYFHLSASSKSFLPLAAYSSILSVDSGRYARGEKREKRGE